MPPSQPGVVPQPLPLLLPPSLQPLQRHQRLQPAAPAAALPLLTKHREQRLLQQAPVLPLQTAPVPLQPPPVAPAVVAAAHPPAAAERQPPEPPAWRLPAGRLPPRPPWPWLLLRKTPAGAVPLPAAAATPPPQAPPQLPPRQPQRPRWARPQQLRLSMPPLAAAVPRAAGVGGLPLQRRHHVPPLHLLPASSAPETASWPLLTSA